jgi:hypothetical protein
MLKLCPTSANNVSIGIRSRMTPNTKSGKQHTNVKSIMRGVPTAWRQLVRKDFQPVICNKGTKVYEHGW